jgi:hypothetical protein
MMGMITEREARKKNRQQATDSPRLQRTPERENWLSIKRQDAKTPRSEKLSR